MKKTRREALPKLWTPGFINVCLSNFIMACTFNLLMPSIPLYVTEKLGIPQSKTGIILASYAVALMFVRPFSGYMVDLYSRKKMLLVGFISYVLIFLGYFNFTAVGVSEVLHNLFHVEWSFYAITIGLFIAIRFLHGITWGISTVSSSTLAIDLVPSERRAEGIGYYGVFMNVAMAIGPFIAIHIYYAYGFQIMLLCAMLMGVLGIVSVSMIKAPERPKVAKQKISLDRFFLVKSWPIFLNQLLPSFAWGTIGPFVAQYGKSHNIDNPGIFFLFWAGGLILSRTFAGRQVDKGHIHSVTASSMVMAALAFFLFSTTQSILSFCLCGVALGIGFGMMFPALQTLYVNMAEHDKRGTANSTYLLGFDLGLALGMLIGGYVTGYMSFSTLYLFDAGICLLSAFIYLAVSVKVYNKRKLV